MFLLLCMIVGAGTAWAEDVTLTAGTNGSACQVNNQDGIKVGTSSKGGDMSITVPANTTTLKIHAAAWKGVSGLSLNITGATASPSSITLTADDGISNNSPFTLNGNESDFEFEITLSNVTDETTLTFTSSIAKRFVVWGASAETGDTSLKENDLALTDAPVALSFDLYNNSTAQVINYTTSSTGAVTVSESNYVDAVVDGTNKTITVTPKAVTPNDQTINVTVSQAADETYKGGTATFTVTITDSTPIPTHTATFSVNGATSTQEFEEGAAITFPENPADVNGKSFVGWVTEAIDEATNDEPDFVTSATMGNADVTYYAVFATVTKGSETEVTDVLSKETTGVTGTSYSAWSGKTATSSAIYAGNSAGDNSSIQLRSNNSNSGVVTTTSGGKVSKIVVVWNSATTDGRTLNVYGKNSAYSSATDLYNSSNQGTLLGTFVKENSAKGAEFTLKVDGDYEYIGFRSNSGAMYLTSVSITWVTGTPDSYSEYCTSVVKPVVERPVITLAANPFLFSTTATITCDTEGATIKYSFDGETWSDYSESLTITATTTIYAKAVKGNEESGVVSATATKNLAEPTVTISGDLTVDLDGGTSVDAGTLTAAVTYNEAAVDGATVTWSSSDEEKATIDENGVVTLLATGSVTFTATYAGNNDYAEATATKTITIIDSKAPGSANKPYTVAEAIAAIDAGTGVTDVYATGIVSEIVTAYNSQHGNITYNISADGTTEADQLQAYRGKSYNGENFTSEDDIQVGDVVVIYGNLTKYGSTYEFAANNQLVSLNRPVITTPSISLSTTSVEATAAGKDGTITVTYKNITSVVAEVQFCDAEGNAATYNWVDAEINSDNNVEYVIDENTSTEARTAYMKVYALDDDANDVYSVLITITQAGYVVDYATLPFEFNGGKSDIESKIGLTQSGLGTDYGSAPTLKFDGSGDYMVLKFNEAPGTLSFDIKGNGFSGGTFKVQTSVDGETYTDLATYTDLGNTQSESFNSLTADVRYIKWVYTNKSSGNVALGNIKLDNEVSVKLAASGYASFCSPVALDLTATEDYAAWAVTAATNSTVTFSKITGAVPAETPFVLYGQNKKGETVSLPIATGETTAVTGNMLIGTLVDTSVTTVAGDYTNFGLSNGAFVKLSDGTVKANKAYLPILTSVVNATARLSIVFEDETTGISRIENGEKRMDNSVYNLQGQRVENPTKGLFIVNGKKVVIK